MYKLAKIAIELIPEVEKSLTEDKFIYSDLKYYFERGGAINDLRLEYENEKLKYSGSNNYLKAVLEEAYEYLNVVIKVDEGKTAKVYFEKLLERKLYEERSLQEVLKTRNNSSSQTLQYIFFFNEMCDEIEQLKITELIESLHKYNSEPENEKDESLKIEFSNNNQAVEFSGSFISTIENRSWIFNFDEFLNDLNAFKEIRSCNGERFSFINSLSK